MKGFAQGLVLKQRHKVTRKWPITFDTQMRMTLSTVKILITIVPNECPRCSQLTQMIDDSSNRLYRTPLITVLNTLICIHLRAIFFSIQVSVLLVARIFVIQLEFTPNQLTSRFVGLWVSTKFWVLNFSSSRDFSFMRRYIILMSNFSKLKKVFPLFHRYAIFRYRKEYLKLPTVFSFSLFA